MKLSLTNLRGIIREAIGASETYMKKVKLREDLQASVVQAIQAGDIKDQKDLHEYFGTIDMSVKALKMIPFEVFVKLAKKE